MKIQKKLPMQLVNIRTSNLFLAKVAIICAKKWKKWP
jgi:hypothetical protein